VVHSGTNLLVCLKEFDEQEKRKKKEHDRTKFPADSLRIPWRIADRLYLCGFRNQDFFVREKFPAGFPEQGIGLIREVCLHRKGILILTD